jgi:hypothetical protein
LTHIWPEKLADNGVVRKWPLASPISLRRPNQAHRHHPHTMGDHPCAWFGRGTLLAFGVQYRTTQQKVLDLSTLRFTLHPRSYRPRLPHSPPPTLLSVVRRQNNRPPQSPMHCLIVVFCFVAPLRLERLSWMRARCIVVLLPLPPCHLPCHIVGWCQEGSQGTQKGVPDFN